MDRRKPIISSKVRFVSSVGLPAVNLRHAEWRASVITGIQQSNHKSNSSILSSIDWGVGVGLEAPLMRKCILRCVVLLSVVSSREYRLCYATRASTQSLQAAHTVWHSPRVDHSLRDFCAVCRSDKWKLSEMFIRNIAHYKTRVIVETHRQVRG